MNRIDFVLTWVDGRDPDWLKERQKYSEEATEEGATSDNRFRDWGLLKYWFRGVENYAPWVRKVFFITWGHVPSWLNSFNPKLEIVHHNEYIPSDYLPTFNSNVIEIFLHRIVDLSDNFVLFNDDMFLTSKVDEKDFFVDGMPKDEALLEAVTCRNTEDKFGHILLNNASVINKYFRKKEVQKANRIVFYSPKYKRELIRNILLSPMEYFSGFRDLHLPSSHTKACFEELWRREEMVFLETAKHRFRSSEDINHWIFKNWNCCKGKIVPRSTNWGRHLELGADDDIADVIMKQRYKTICINDSDNSIDFIKAQEYLDKAFKRILPNKSSFEL